MDEPEHVLSLSYGKDSLACLGAIEELGWPLDRIIHAEVWATDTIPADLPPMVEFKKKADRIIKERWGIEVEHVCATTTYERCFYSPITKQGEGFENRIGLNRGFPYQKGPWCQRDLKIAPMDAVRKKTFERDIIYKIRSRGHRIGENVGWPMAKANECQNELKISAIKTPGAIQYIGIAADEPERFHDLSETKKSPLVAAGWTEGMCRKWCEENDLLSPIYITAARGGCWFCHNQGVQQLRLLRHNYPELWALMLKWDADSPVLFKANGQKVMDFERRFVLEDRLRIDTDVPGFRWEMLDKGIPDKYLIKAATSWIRKKEEQLK